ncbi:MAG: DUF3325 domain-containing protein [Proteobacteria bacterium]|nr:DUF3325 domain-containing protein [Pseudomonadota bacterium]
MQLEPFLLSYAGFASIALTTQRIRRNIAMPNLPKIGALRIFAAILFSLAASRAVDHFGAEKGWVAFIGMVCLSAVPLVLMISRWPRVGVSAGLGAVIVGLGAMLLNGAG